MGALSLSLVSDMAQLETLQSQIAETARSAGVDPKSTARLMLAFEEVFVNICLYAYPDEPGPIRLRCHLEGGEFVTEIADEGPPFDPDCLPEPDPMAGIDERPVGGLGWFLVHRLVDRVESSHDDRGNCVRLFLSLAP